MDEFPKPLFSFSSPKQLISDKTNNALAPITLCSISKLRSSFHPHTEISHSPLPTHNTTLLFSPAHTLSAHTPRQRTLSLHTLHYPLTTPTLLLSPAHTCTTPPSKLLTATHFNYTHARTCTHRWCPGPHYPPPHAPQHLQAAPQFPPPHLHTLHPGQD